MSATPGMRSSGVRQTKQTRQTDRPTARQPASQRQTDRQTDRRPARQTDKRSFRFKEPVRHWVLNYFIDIDDNDDDDDGGGDDDHDYRMMTMMAVMTAIMMTIVVATIPFAYYVSITHGGWWYKIVGHRQHRPLGWTAGVCSAWSSSACLSSLSLGR